MIIPASTMRRYRDALSKINKKAAEQMQAYCLDHNFEIDQAMIDYAYALSTKYGEAAGALSCQLYDEVAEYWHEVNAKKRPYMKAAEPDETAGYGEVAKTVYGTAKTSPKQIPDAVGRLVKRTAEDTTLKNAIRDGAYFAWIPHGDTCAFCLMLASNGWQRASKKALKGGHAEHIHAHCDCTYMIKFSPDDSVEGYDSEEYRRMYSEAEGDNWQDKINAMRRERYKVDGDKIRAQKKLAYAKKNWNNNALKITAVSASTVSEKVKSGECSLKLSEQQYNKHIRGTMDYERYRKSREEKGLSSQSVLTISKEESQKIIESKSGTGILKVRRDGTPTNIEWITCDHVVGEYMDKGIWIKTNKAAIHHGKRGSHLVPIKGANYD